MSAFDVSRIYPCQTGKKNLLEISMKGQQVCQSHSVDMMFGPWQLIHLFMIYQPVVVINMTFKPIQNFDRGNSPWNWKRRDHTAVVYQCKPKCTQSLRYPLSKRDQPTNGDSLVGLRQLINIWVRGSSTAWYCSVLPGTVQCCLVLHGTFLELRYCMILSSIAWYFIVLFCICPDPCVREPWGKDTVD